MLELVLVVVLVGIVAAVAAPRFFDAGAFRAATFADELAAAIRYGQKAATAARCPVKVTINGIPDGESSRFAYAVRYEDDPGNSFAPDCSGGAFTFPLPRPGGAPGESWQLVSTDVALGANAFSVIFDRAGRASNSLSIPVGGRTVRVEAGTGLTYVE